MIANKSAELPAEINPNVLDEPRLHSLLEHWRRKRRGTMPARADIDPLEMKEHLGNLFIAEPVQEQNDFRYRLMGSNLTALHGRDYTGWTVRQVFATSPPEQLEDAIRAYKFVVSKKANLRVKGRVLWVDKEYIAFDSLFLPICSPNGNQVWVLGKLIFDLDDRALLQR